MALPSIGFAAPIIRAAIATLQASMPGQVAAFNAELENDVELAEPQTYHFGAQPLLSAYSFPQIEIAIVAGDTGNWAINRAEFDHDLRLNVAIWVDGSDGEVPPLYERILGLTRCVIECLSPRNAFGTGVEIAESGGVSWRPDVIPFDPTASSPAEGRDFQAWLGSGLLQFRLETIERLV